MNGVDLSNPGNISIGFIIVLVSMTAIAAFLFWYFKKKQWIMAKEKQEEDSEKQGSSKR